MNYLLLITLILAGIFLLTYLIFYILSITHGSDDFFTEIINQYRLGDTVMYTHGFEDYLNRFWYAIYFNKSIAREYMRKTYKHEQYDILYDIVKKRINNKTQAPQDAVIIHLRIGDVIEREFTHSVDDALTNKHQLRYLKPYSYYKENLEKVKEGVNKVILVGGFHCVGNHSRSYEYVNKIEKYIQDMGFKTEKRIGNFSADEDFVYMSSSKYFLGTGGNFSHITNEMVKRNNGQVLSKKISY